MQTKSFSAESAIFRHFGQKKSVTTYHLPDFLYGYLVAGSGTIRTGNKSYTLAAGDSFVVARNHEATLTLCPEEGPSGYFHTINIRIPEEEVEDFFLHSTHPRQAASTPDGLLCQLPDHPLLHGLTLLLEDGMQLGFRAEGVFLKMKIQECIYILVTLNKQIYHWLSAFNHPHKINLREFMEKNFYRNIPLEQLAASAGRSLSTFRRDFMNEFGTTPSRWLIARRLDEAQRLITSGLRPGEILVELGFESFSHFTRRFKERFGILPSTISGTCTGEQSDGDFRLPRRALSPTITEQIAEYKKNRQQKEHKSPFLSTI